MEFKIRGEKALIGISSKILGVDYPELIHKNNIERCMGVISTYDLFTEVNVPLALSEGQCNKLEVTRDIAIRFTKSEYEDMARMVLDSRKWNTQVRYNSFGVMHANDCESIKFYDKEHEMGLSKNRNYVQDFRLDGNFDGLTRVESKLLSAKAIRKRFGNNGLHGVLTSLTNPLMDIIDEVFIDLENSGSTHKVRGNFLKKNRDRQRLAYAMEFGYNFSDIAIDMKGRDPDNWTREFNKIKAVAEIDNPDIFDIINKIAAAKNMLQFL
jgi:hypothetical protein